MKSFLNNLTALFSKIDLKRSTSISDSKQYSGYLASVKKAVSNTETFLKFRSDPNYVAVLEHVTQDEGQQYLRIAKEEFGFSPNKLSLLQDLSLIHI